MTIDTRPAEHRVGTTTPLACIPAAIPGAERPLHFALLARLFTTEVRERRALPDGYAYRFDAGAYDDVARWIGHERNCCPFLTITIELTPGAGPILVSLTGPAGTRELLDAELPPRTH